MRFAAPLCAHNKNKQFLKKFHRKILFINGYLRFIFKLPLSGLIFSIFDRIIMYMYKQINLALALLLIVSLSACASSKASEDRDSEIISSRDIDLETHFALEQKWLDAGVDSYEMTVSYSAFSPMKGVWKITVIDGVLISWEKDSIIDVSELKFQAEAFMIENLYKLAEDSYEDIGNYKQETLYWENGLIKDIRKYKNSDKENGPSADRGFHILVTNIDLKKEN